MGLKTLTKGMIGESNLGRLEFFRSPDRRNIWGGPFNGQKFRQRIFFDLLYRFPITALVETGTYHGTTTALFAATSLPVYSVESHPRYFAYSQMRFLWNRTNVHLYRNDSRSFLKDLSEDASVSKEDVFFYLDAHWDNDLPLRDELELIFSNWVRPIVMIDDFQVPGSDYAFDEYGPGKALDLHYLDPVVSARKISVFFPAVGSSEETGGRRGCAVLCEEITCTEMEKSVSTLVKQPLRP